MYAIRVEGLGRKYGDKWAVRDLNFYVGQGEVFGLLGPNGAGKTTTMRMLACLIAPTEGRAEVCGFSTLSGAREVRARVGILTEAPGLYGNRSVEQNLLYFSRLYGIERSRAHAQIERYLKLLGLWSERHDPAGTLSKGMKQKLSMARALLHEPPVMILDEPTSALDAEGAKMVRDFILSLRLAGRAILLCTHNLPEAQQLCDRVAIIKGTLLHEDTPDGLRRALYRRQVEVRLAEAAPTLMHRYASIAAEVSGVAEATAHEGRLLIAAEQPEVTPDIVQALASRGARILRVAEVEYTLEQAYLDLVGLSREDEEAEEMGADEREKVVA